MAPQVNILAWVGIMLGLLLAIILIGWLVSKRPAGILIDSTNHISLSRLQIILWTVLTMSAYLMFAFIRLLNPLDTLTEEQINVCVADRQAGEPTLTEAQAKVDCGRIEPLQITFPEELILVMGISVASFAGSNLIQSTKKNMQLSGDTETRLLENAKKILKDAQRKEMEAKEAADKAAAEARASVDAKVEDAKATAIKAREDAKVVEAMAVKARADANLKTVASKGALVGKVVLSAITGVDVKVAEAQAKAAKAEADVKLAEAQAKIKVKEVEAKEAEDQARRNIAGKIRDTQARVKDANAKSQEIKEALEEKKGVLQTKSTPADAKWMDLFRGNEVADFQYVHLGKVQMFLFTIVVLFAYAIAIANLLGSDGLLHPVKLDFPPFSDTLNVLLGISHAGYLSVKAVNQS